MARLLIDVPLFGHLVPEDFQSSSSELRPTQFSIPSSLMSLAKNLIKFICLSLSESGNIFQIDKYCL